MAAHSACAISGGAVTVRRAPPARLRPAGGLARPTASARRGARPRRASPAPRSPWPASPGLAGHASPGTRRDTHLAGRAPGRTSACEQACKRATGHINSRYQLHMITARPPQLLFYRHGPVSVWESTGRSRSATTGGLSAVRIFQSQQVSGMEYGLAGGKEPRPVRGSSPAW
jgi:hypothetical protein